MPIKNDHTPIAEAVTAPLRSLVVAGFVAVVIGFAAAPAVRADSVVAPSAATEQSPAQVSREYLIKAAILFNFAKFAEWPAAAFTNDTATLRICVLGDDPFGPALDSINGRTVADRTLVAAPIARIEDAATCHILFVSASERGRLATILQTIGTLPILTVADMGEFTNSGGIVALKTAEDRSRLEINVGAAKKAGVKLSSKLLRLADTVGTQTARAAGK